MANDANTATSQDETLNEVADPQTETVTTSDAGETPEEETTTEKPSSPSIDEARIKRIEAALKKANSEAKNYRLEAEELKKYKEAAESAKLTDQERLDKEREQLKQQLADLQKAHEDTIRQAKEYKVNTEVRLQAAQSGFSDPNDAVKFLNWDDIETDDDGNPTNVSELVANLLKTKPYLAKPTSRSAPAVSATNPSRSNRTADDPTEYINKLKAGTLKNDEFNALPRSLQTKIIEAINTPKR
jgi:multidrug efflux pump subunit AcrA (membrane-fusion protein)